MEISLLAGKPASLELLANVPRLIAVSYNEIPDPSVPDQVGIKSLPGFDQLTEEEAVAV
jgi:hypothetical protein